MDMMNHENQRNFGYRFIIDTAEQNYICLRVNALCI